MVNNLIMIRASALVESVTAPRTSVGATSTDQRSIAHVIIGACGVAVKMRRLLWGLIVNVHPFHAVKIKDVGMARLLTHLTVSVPPVQMSLVGMVVQGVKIVVAPSVLKRNVGIAHSETRRVVSVLSALRAGMERSPLIISAHVLSVQPNHVGTARNAS